MIEKIKKVRELNRLNCWEFKQCGREPEGLKIGEFGVCPATTETRLHGTHGGVNSGRACWVIAGSMCNGSMQVPLLKNTVTA